MEMKVYKRSLHSRLLSRAACVWLLATHPMAYRADDVEVTKGLFTWSGGPRSSGVAFFWFHALEDTKQKKPSPLDWGPPLHVNRV